MIQSSNSSARLFFFSVTIDHEPKPNVSIFRQRLFCAHQMKVISDSTVHKFKNVLRLKCHLFHILWNEHRCSVFDILKSRKPCLNLTIFTSAYRSKLHNKHFNIVSKYLSNFRQNIPFPMFGHSVGVRHLPYQIHTRLQLTKIYYKSDIGNHLRMIIIICIQLLKRVRKSGTQISVCIWFCFVRAVKSLFRFDEMRVKKKMRTE